MALPLGFAQYAFAVFEEGHYLLAALGNGVVIDSLRVRVERLAALRLSGEVRVSTHGEGCSGADQTTPDALVLHPNQLATFWVVPVALDGRPMLGLLDLTAEAPDIVQLDATLIGRGQPANSLEVTPVDLHDGHVAITLREQSDDVDLRITIATDDDEPSCAQR